MATATVQYEAPPPKPKHIVSVSLVRSEKEAADLLALVGHGYGLHGTRRLSSLHDALYGLGLPRHYNDVTFVASGFEFKSP